MAGNSKDEQDPFAQFQSEGFLDGVRTDLPSPKDDEDDDQAGDSDEDDQDDDSDEDAGQVENDDDQDDDSDEDDDQDDDSDEDDDPAPKKKRQTARQRIAEVTAARRQAERERDEALAEIRRRDAEKQKQQATPDDGASDDDPAAPEKPDPQKFKYGEVDPAYISAMIKYETAQELAKERAAQEKTRQQEAADRADQELKTKLDERLADGVKAFDDFQTVVVDGAKDGTWALTRVTAELIADSPVGAQIAYHLASNPAESARISGLSDIQQAAQIGKLEAQFSKPAKSDGAKRKSAKPSKAPKPPRQQPRGKGGRFKTRPDTGDFAAFEALANSEMNNG